MHPSRGAVHRHGPGSASFRSCAASKATVVVLATQSSPQESPSSAVSVWQCQVQRSARQGDSISELMPILRCKHSRSAVAWLSGSLRRGRGFDTCLRQINPHFCFFLQRLTSGPRMSAALGSRPVGSGQMGQKWPKAAQLGSAPFLFFSGFAKSAKLI